MDNLYQNDYNKNFTNVDEIFSIADLNDNIELGDSAYEIYQVRNHGKAVLVKYARLVDLHLQGKVKHLAFR